MNRRIASFAAAVALCTLSLSACHQRVNNATAVSAIQTKLQQDNSLNDYYVHLESRNGVLVVSGVAPNAKAKQTIVSLLNSTGHPKTLSDKMTLAAPAPAAPSSNDAAIEAEFRAKLSANSALANLPVEAASNGGVLTLTGFVRSAAQKGQVGQMAHQLQDVRSVVNQIQVRSGPMPPSVTLKVTPRLITPGKSAVLTWVAHNATSLELEPGIGRVRPQGSRTVRPKSNTTYTLIATGPQGRATTTAQLNVWNAVPPPKVTLNAAPLNIPRGRSTRLSWSSQDATSLDIEPGIGRVSPQGSRAVSPPGDTTYTLTGTGPGGQTTATAHVTVSNPASALLPEPIATLKASSESITEGQSTLLSWATENASRVSIQPGLGPVPARGSVTVRPKQSTTYVLTARGSGQSAIAKASVNVVPSGPSQGTIVWEGEIHGVTPVSIEGDHASVGTIVSGGLPGQPCTVRLENSKGATLQTSPAQWNGWKLILLQVRGNGNVTVQLSWSLLR